MRLGIREKFLIPIILIVAVGMASIIIYFYFSSTEAIEEAASNGLAREVDLTVKLMDDWIETRKQDLATWSLQPVLVEALTEGGYYGRSARMAAGDYLRDLNQGYNSYELLFVVDLKGAVVSASRKIQFNIADRIYFQRAMVGEPSMDEIVVSRYQGDQVLAAAAPIRKEGQVVGALVGGVRLATLNTLFVDWFKLGRDGYAFLTDEKGRVLTHSKSVRPELDNLSRFDFGRRMLARGHGIIIYSYNETQLISGYGRLKNVPWLFVATQSLDEAFAPSLRSGKYSFVTGLGILVAVSLVIGLLFRLTIYRPINDMLRVMRHVEKGALDKRVERKPSGDEIGRLTTVFNTMIRRLERTVRVLTNEVEVRRGAEAALAEHRDNLEKLVKERTLELEKEISERWQAELSLRYSEGRLRQQTGTLRELARQKPLFSGDLKTALPAISEAAARTLGLSRASIWLFEQDRSELVCVECYPERTSSSEAAPCIQPPHDYLNRLEKERVISVSDGRKQESYFRQCGGVRANTGQLAFLEAAIMLGGELKGVACFKHDGPQRDWRLDEQHFAGSIADFVSLALETFERLQAEEAKKNLETRLHRSEKMEAIGTLAGGVAHDLNNILSAIISYPELLLMNLPKDSPMVNPIRTIRESGEKAAAIVQDLLTLARRGVSVTEVVNLNDIVQKYMKSPEFGRLMSFHPKVVVTVSLASDLLNIAGSPVHLSKTIMNLVSNAAEAMPDGGSLGIETENRYVDRPIRGYDQVQEGDYVVLSVVDSGLGIPEEDLGRIFEPFFTKKKNGPQRYRVRDGRGLGDGQRP